jgi:hypothetical protein
MAPDWILASGGRALYHDDPSALSIGTADGIRMAVPGDWVVRFPAGTFRPFTGEQFADLYEPAPDGAMVPVGAGELAAFGLMAERLEGLLAEARALADSAAADERERIRAGAGSLKVTLSRPGNGPAQAQALEVVPLEGLLGLLAGGGAVDVEPEGGPS